MSKKLFILITAAFLTSAAIIDLLIIILAYIHQGATGMIILIIAIDAVLLFVFRLLIYRPFIKLKNAVRDFSLSHNWDEFSLAVSGLLPPDLLSSVYEMRNQSRNFADAQKQAEYLALQNQINPHFLYNTLEALRGDTLYEGLTSVASVIEALATFFRYTITDTGNLTSLENEIEHAENYFVIQKYRFEDKIDMKIILPENEPKPMNYLLPKLTLQPIIENSIFHGLEKKSGIGHITVEIETTEKFLFINISDTGIGIDPDMLHNINQALENSTSENTTPSPTGHRSIALKNVSRRIRLLFGAEYGLHVYSTPGIGTDVRIILPKIKEKDLTI